MHPFAYRTHAHKLGVVKSGYVVKTSQDNSEEWTEIGRRSPQLPQMFFPVSNKELEVKKGDVLAARCTMRNNRDHIVSIGSTGDDEMCNFYIMYYVKGDRILDQNICMTYGPPFWSFANFVKTNGHHLDLKQIPSDISQVPANQELEMSDMKMMKGMKEMNVNENIKRSNKEAEEDQLMAELAKEVANVKQKNELLEEGEEESEENSNGSQDNGSEYEANLNQLQKEYLEKNLIEKLLRKNTF